MTDPGYASNLRLNLFGDLLGALWNRKFRPFACTCLICGCLKERSGNTPFAREGDRLPFQPGERDIVRCAIGFDFVFDELLFFLKHKRSNPVGRSFEIISTRNKNGSLATPVIFT